MEENKLIKFSIDQELSPEQIENMQFSKVKMKIYSADKINAHGYYISLKNLKKWANTIAGKPIIMYYNAILNDFASHEKDEIACGFVPFDPELSYEKTEDGTVYLCVIGYIWNMYYDYVINVFNNSNNEKGLSCEMLILDSQYDAELDAEEILQYSFAGLTLLGDYDKNFIPIKPAVDGCDATLVQNSDVKEDFEKAKNEFEQFLYNSVKQESFNEGSFFNKENLKEKLMEDKELVMNSETPTSIEDVALVENAEVTENAVKEVTNRVSVETSTWEYDDNGDYVGHTHEEHRMSETHFEETNDTVEVLDNASEDVEIIENADTEEVVEENAEVIENTCKKDDNDCEEDSEIVENAITEEMYNELLQKNATLENEINQLKVEYNSLVIKCSALQEFKNNTEEKEMKNSVELVLNSVSHILNADQIDDWRKESVKYSIDNLCDFTNRLKAFAFDIQEKNGTKEVESIRNSIPKNIVEIESDDVWDRLNKKFVNL